MAPGNSSKRWEELRKDARKLESELDHRLAAYSKIGSSYSLAGVSGGLDPSEAQHRAVEIEGLLAQLQEVNEAMATCAAAGGGGGGSSELQSHTLARHNNILTEFIREFGRTKHAVAASLERAQLLGGFSGVSSSTRGNQAGATPGSDAHLRNERTSIRSALSQADSVISQAQATSGALSHQRSLLGGTFSKVSTIGSKIPLVNSVLNAIRRKKSRDNIILSAVVFACTLFLLIYWVNK